MTKNTQAPEKRVLGDGSILEVNSVFHTIQGEGPFAGCPAVFVRLAGCNLQCPMCDTEYTRRAVYEISDLVAKVNSERYLYPALLDGEAGAPVPPPKVAPTDLVVITGGEPMRQPTHALVWSLLSDGYRVQIETNGTLYQPGLPYGHANLTIVCSPKAGNVHRMLLPWVSAWKYVAAEDSIDPVDGLPTHALEHPATRLFRPPADHPAPIYLQPADHRNIQPNYRAQAAVVQACLEHGHRLCLQMHKIVGVD